MKALVCDLGRMSYGGAWDLQVQVAGRVKDGTRPDTLLLVEHDPILTLGASFHEENLLFTADEYRALGIPVVRTDRGGDVTYHGPNQLVIYPIFDVSRFGRDLHKWLRDLEETMILTLSEFGLEGYRFPPNTGAWVKGKKIAAIGVKISRWVSTHGIALNCDNDLKPFETIVPCGIHDYGVTSLSSETGKKITIENAKPVVVRAFERVFDLRLESISLAELMDETEYAAPPQTLS